MRTRQKNIVKITAVLISALLLFGCKSKTPQEKALDFAETVIECRVDFAGQTDFSGNLKSDSVGNGEYTVDSPESIKGLTFKYENSDFKISYEGAQLTALPQNSPVVELFFCLDAFRKGEFMSDDFGKYKVNNISFSLDEKGFLDEIMFKSTDYTGKIIFS